jgi:hypothetical protein
VIREVQEIPVHLRFQTAPAEETSRFLSLGTVKILVRSITNKSAKQYRMNKEYEKIIFLMVKYRSIKQHQPRSPKRPFKLGIFCPKYQVFRAEPMTDRAQSVCT